MAGMEDISTVNGSVDGEAAIRLKELGNADFKNGHYDKAIEHYSKAIGLLLTSSFDKVETPSVDKRTLAICLTNRAQCHIKIEEFGTAIEDATKALAADPTFFKV
jgi:serine/threonine-protein phosphatase 5